MTNGARNRQRNAYRTGGYSYEFPEFGQLLLMLLEFLANYFKSMFPGLVSPQGGVESNQNNSDNDFDNDDDSDNDDDYTPGRSYTPGMQARSAQRPSSDAQTASYSPSIKPSRK